MAVRHHIKGPIEVVAHVPAEAGPVDYGDVLDGLGLRWMRLGQRGEEQLNELAVPHTLLWAVHNYGRNLQAGQ
jgi:hypothetical protein